MYCVKSGRFIEDVIKKSRFLGVVIACRNEREVLEQLKSLHQQHAAASHIAYAYRLKTDAGIVYRFHDAGEPTGTAGKPIYQHLEGKELINVLAVVIRYYGGVKLGAGGLTRAYGNTAGQAIEAAEIVPYVECLRMVLTLDYQRIQQFEYTLKKLGGLVINQEFGAQARFLIELPAAQLEALQQNLPECDLMRIGGS